MGNLIAERVVAAREGRNPYVIAPMKSGWLVIGDVQPLPGYCVFLADPVVAQINDLAEAARVQYSLDVLRAGDAILAATGAARMNYETLGNSEPALHTHLIPRYANEPEAQRRIPAFMAYSWAEAQRFNPAQDKPLIERIRRLLPEGD